MAFGAHDEFALGKPPPDARQRGAAKRPVQNYPHGPQSLVSQVVRGKRLAIFGIKDESNAACGETNSREHGRASVLNLR